MPVNPPQSPFFKGGRPAIKNRLKSSDAKSQRARRIELLYCHFCAGGNSFFGSHHLSQTHSAPLFKKPHRHCLNSMDYVFTRMGNFYGYIVFFAPLFVKEGPGEIEVLPVNPPQSPFFKGGRPAIKNCLKSSDAKSQRARRILFLHSHTRAGGNPFLSLTTIYLIHTLCLRASVSKTTQALPQ